MEVFPQETLRLPVRSYSCFHSSLVATGSFLFVSFHSCFLCYTGAIHFFIHRF